MNLAAGGSTPLLSDNLPGPANSAGRLGSKVKDTEPLPGREKLALTTAGTPNRRTVFLEAIEIPIGSFAMDWVRMAEFVT